MSKWRVIRTETRDAFENMAIDEAVSEQVATQDSPPTIRFYRWNPSAISIGYFQSLLDEVAVDECEDSRVDYVRRRTGGGAVYHDYDGELTYSVIGPESIFPKGIIDSYHCICGWIMDGLAKLGVETEFKPINDIVMADGSVGVNGEHVGGKKISGNAQTRRQGVLLQHGTILYKVDVRKMFSLLKVGQEKISDKMISAVEDRVTSISALNPDLAFEDLYEGLLEGFTKGKKWDYGEWTLAEMMRAQDLAERKYATKEWKEMR
jgi:lipoate-protein ligase A